MYRLRVVEGLTLRELGERFGIGPERVRQLLNRYVLRRRAACRSTPRRCEPASPTTHVRVRQDKVDATGKVTLRYMSRLHHIGIGRAHKNHSIKLLIADRNIRIIDPKTAS